MKSPRDIADEEFTGCLGRIQKRLDVEDGHFASIYFSGISKESRGYEEAVQMLTDYIIAENKFGCKRESLRTRKKGKTMNKFGRSLQLTHIDRGYWQISAFHPETGQWLEIAHCTSEKKAYALLDTLDE